MGNFILDEKFRGRIANMSASLIKMIMASVFLFGSWMNVQALVITAENGTVCPNEGVILNSSLATSSSVTWQKKVNGAWVNASEEGSQLKVGVPFIYEMDDHDVTFRAVEKLGTKITVTSNELTIKKGTDCVPECHSSSTGDFISGTDFDPTGANSGKLENDVENFFGEYALEFSKAQLNYTIGGLKSSFGNYTPSIDDSVSKKTEGNYENYFMNLKNPNGTVVEIRFPANPKNCDHGFNHHDVSYRRQNYRFVMRAYVKPTCNIDQNSAFRARTGHGTVTEDRMDVELYDDETGRLLGSLTDLKSQNDVAEVKFSSLTNVRNLPMSGGQYHMLRFEITFYGYMPYVNEGLSHYAFTPEFAQLSCADIAIDYISAEVEKVCLSPKMVCSGETVHATATGFPKNASYTWYEYDGKNWYELLGMSGRGDKYRTANIKVTFVGSRQYKVVVNKNDGTNTTVTKEFTVYGKECNPIMPNEIIGTGMICAPSTEEVFYVDPVSEDATVEYRWKLITPSGKVIDNSTVYDGLGLEVDAATKGSSVRLMLPAMSETGKYTLQAQVVRNTKIEGKNVTLLIGDPITKTIMVHNTPTPKLTLTGNYASGTAEQDKTLCPADITTKLVANVDVTNKSTADKYIYTWTGASANSKTPTSAEVSWDHAAACAGTLKDHTITVNVKIDGTTCEASATQKYKFEKLVAPTIDCSKIDGIEKVLGPTDKTMTIDLAKDIPFPTYSSSCDPDPTMTIDVVVKDLDGKKLEGLNQSRTITFRMSQLETTNTKVEAPAGTVSLTYTVKDGCDRTETCEAVITVSDKTAPNVNCDLIPNYKAHLKNQKGCVAVPGDYFQELPKISVPRLPDLNGVDGTITGVYKGRLEKSTEPAKLPTAGFSTKLDYNAPYNKGITWILWAFSDKSGNTEYCLQKIEVIDDKDPNVTCPNIDLGTLDVDTLTCTLKPSSVIAKVKEVAKLPYGFDECSSDPTDSLVPTLYYRMPNESKDLIKIEDSQLDDPIFETGTNYEIVWVFKKKPGAFVDEKVSVECAIPFIVEDQDAPEFDCSSLMDIMVYPNFRITTTDVEYEKYASGMGQTKDEEGKTYTLKKYFDDGYLSMHDDVIDICGGNVTIDITITRPDGKKDIITSLTQFKKYQFKAHDDETKENTYTITYTFTDARFNSKTCEQTVTVVRNSRPIPDCNTAPVVMYKDADCKSLYSLSLDEIPTASVTYYRTAKYGTCKSAPGPAGQTKPGDCSKMLPVTKADGPLGKEYTFDDFNEISGSRSGFKEISVYPDSVRLYDASGKVITAANPLDPKTDRVVTKDVTFRTFSGDGQCNCKEDVPYSYATANLSNFRVLPAILNKYDLPIGVNKYVWYFSNTFEATDPASKVLVDSCVITIEVKDTISPKLDCGKWGESSSFKAKDQTCELSQAEVNVKIPDPIKDLNVVENCTDPDKLVLSWVRTFNGKKSTDLTAPYKVGVTTIDWIVKDSSGNSSTCTQIIEVEDTLGPPVDCDVVTPPLIAYADANCVAEADVVKKVGLQIPEIDDDPCSPTGSMIKGVGVRSDGKEIMTDAYPKGVTTITWTFTDAAGAFSVCKQTITILDTIKPTFDCSEILDTTVALESEKCELSLSEVIEILGSHTATDNCDGDINGVPMLDNKGVEIPLKAPFEALHKDTTYHFIWHFVDKAGNDKTCDQYLTVADVTPPSISDECDKLQKQDPVVVALDACEVPFSSLNINLNSSIVDKCDGEIKAKVQAFIYLPDGDSLRYDDEEITNVMFPVGTHKFLYIYTDKAGLSDTCIVYRIVKDGTAPEILDCFNTPESRDTIRANVSDGHCSLTYDDLSELIILPKAHDLCDDIANGGSILFIDPVVKRYFWNDETKEFELEVDGQDNEEWKVDSFRVGVTKLKFIFTDKSGNSDSCIKFVRVEDIRFPYFDCSEIDPNPFYPTAQEGDCSVRFEGIVDYLNRNEYWAIRACTEDSIKGVLTLYGDEELKSIPDTFQFHVGRDYHLLWVFRDPYDKRQTTCDQIIRPNHRKKLVPNCTNADDISKLATEGRCEIPGAEVITLFPFALDPCTDDTVWGVPHRSDSLEISDPFPTGYTNILWTMVSPYNVNDTAYCKQKISILGNKHFDLDCETLAPAMHRVVNVCGPIVMEDTLKVPYAEDPCANPDSSYYMREGVGTRSDDSRLDPIKDTYPLGQTYINWVFTDFTGSVKDSCNQLVDIRTSLPLKVNCDSLNNDTITIPVATGECSVPDTQVMDSLIKRGFPKAEHPCGLGEFIGIPTRPNGLTMKDPFYIGVNEIIWVFVDSTTHTLADSIVTCSQYVQVGDVNVPPVDCSQMPDTTVILTDNCWIEFGDLGFDIKEVKDLCTGALITPDITRSSNGVSSNDPAVVFDEPFYVGVIDTIRWNYQFQGYKFLCEQIIKVKDSIQPLIDCEDILDKTIILPEGKCDISSGDVKDSLDYPFATEFCTREQIKGEPQLMTINGKDTVYGALPAKFEVRAEPYKISWLFANDSLTVFPKRCDFDLTIMSSSKPVFDCSVYDDTVKKNISGACDVVLDETILPIPAGKDFCLPDSVVYGKGYMIDTNDGSYSLLAEMKGKTPSYKVGKLDVGVYKIGWVFESKFSVAKDTCVETLNILTDKTIDIDCIVLPEFDPSAPGSDSCSMEITLNVPLAKNPCTNEVILPDTVIRSDGVPFTGVNDVFRVGKTTVTWVFVDHSKTLQDSIAECVQVVEVKDVKTPPINCPEDVNHTLPLGECQLDPTTINILDNEPTILDYCVGETIAPKVWRTSGKSITDPFELGVDTVVREYLYHGETYTCKQVIKVRNAGIDEFSCDMLGISTNNDTFTVELRTAGNTVPFSDVQKVGFKLPDLTVINKCGQLIESYKRFFEGKEENKDITDPYQLGVTTIIYDLKDTTHGLPDNPESIKHKTCTKYIKVINTAAPSLKCPSLDETQYVCYKDLLAKHPAYKNLNEFINSADIADSDKKGQILDLNGFDAHDLVNASTFKLDSVILDVNNDKVSTLEICEFTLTRTYSAKDILGQDVKPCSQTFHVKDDQAPDWIGDIISDFTEGPSQCAFVTSIDNSKIKANDDCWNDVFDTPTEKTSSTSLKSGIFYTDWTNRASDPTDCYYYSYDMTRTYVSYDRCGNQSTPIVYTRKVEKTEKPQINLPQSFINLVIPANPYRPCMYEIPNVDSLLPPSAISDYCGDPIAVQNFIHEQKPPKGTIVNTQAGFVNVTIVITDPCGNKDSLVKKVMVPTREDVISVALHDDVICAEENLLLSDSRFLDSKGHRWEQNWFDKTKWDFVETSAIWYDYYKGNIHEDSVMYSSNPNTYKWKFDQVLGVGEYLKLDSYLLSDTFYVIAMDTVSFCTDTTKAYIEIRQAPTVKLTPELFTICEDDSLHLISDDVSLYDRFNVFTYENGVEITKEGWIIDDDEYEPNTKITYSEVPRDLKYYATNACGTSMSTDVISLNTQAKMNPDRLMLVTKPQNKPRVFMNESAELKLVSNYDPYEYHWYKVNGPFDGRFGEVFDKFGEVKSEYKDLVSEPDSLLEVKTRREIGANMYELIGLQDTASYYVLMLDSVCPAVPSNVVSINVIKDIPTAFTPSNSIGMNDTFMEGYPVIIFNRYGQKMVESNNGWDGKCRGELVDPGVYFYEITLKDNSVHKGTIEVVYFK